MNGRILMVSSQKSGSLANTSRKQDEMHSNCRGMRENL